jgi:signal transduction histidine kinase
LNLVSNALKFTSYDGNITIKSQIRKFTSSKRNEIYVEVEDDGLGISEENQSKLFKIFGYINDKEAAGVNKKGIGLGLAISKKIVEEFGGKIDVRSKLHEGTTFSFIMK